MNIGDTVKIGRETYKVIGGARTSDFNVITEKLFLDRHITATERTIRNWATARNMQLIGYGWENQHGYVHIRYLA